MDHIIAEGAWAYHIPFPSLLASHSAFNDPLSLDDIARIKAYLKCTTHSSTTGVDAATYDLLMEIDNNCLLPLFQRAVECLDIPSSWLTSTIILQNLVNTPPKWQTTRPLLSRAVPTPCFCEGYHTNNNSFILHTIIDKARSQMETIYAAFVDISNAFPSTNQSSLWNKLSNTGLTGKYFDWL
ncbi:hypothetical protein EV368DRAFT_41465 [Lentinula lateritia]|nr:hypothetical protein EV368DRAFT_41465 [Lentinula lateritia]